jgi:hypothetical protein
MAYSCKNRDCTVAATKTCVLLRTPLESCEFFVSDGAAAPPESSSSPDPLETIDVDARHFFPGFELGTADAAEIMRGRYGTLIAVLGQYDVGKTCFLISLYLLIACRAIGTELAFAGSLTLNGFEARARRIRKWKNGTLPKQFADHTVLADPRMPALLHLALRTTDSERTRHDLLITDLPGEWSTDLVKDVQTADRFDFLKRADGIIISLDGPMLSGDSRHAAADDAKNLLTRLCDAVKVDRSVPLVLMITKSDEISMTIPPIVDSVVAHAKAKGFNPQVVAVAAISRTPEKVKSGTGVLDVIERVLDRKSERPPLEEDLAGDLRGRNFAGICG